MAALTPPLIGVVEGFYGRAWDPIERNGAAKWFAALGLNTYLYAPKSQRYLRSRWRDPFPEVELSVLGEMASAYRGAGLRWGLGLSPLGVNQGLGSPDLRALRSKVAQIAALKPDILALLFDDMSHSNELTAPRQLECLTVVQEVLPDTELIVCPTYYSSDPVLEEVFGPIPTGYIDYYQRHLDPRVAVFWTGPKVCSSTIGQSDIEVAKQQWGERLVLWDNYPVNDGRVRSQHLYLKPLAARTGGTLLHGHLCNPMNQLHLSTLGLSGLSALYQQRSNEQIERQLAEILGSDFRAWAAEHAERFETVRLDDLGHRERDALVSTLRQFKGAAARECMAWLAGEYRFDPACLTE